MRVAVLLNAGAGALRNGKTEQSLELLKTALRDRGVSANFESCAGEELRSAAERALQAARTGKIDAVVVGGGDGSIRTVASVFAGTDVPLGVLPLGTLNHFAKDLGIPTDPQAAADVIAAGKTRNVDTAQVNGLTFVNNSSIGIYPYLVIDRERRQARHGYSKWVAAGFAAFRALRFFPVRRLSIRTSDTVEPCRSPCVLIGNNEYVLSGPSFASRERLDGGQLCVYVTKHQRPASLVWHVIRTVFGFSHSKDEFRILRAPTAEIRSATSRLLVALDGEVEVLRTPLHYETQPGALRVLIPVSAE